MSKNLKFIILALLLVTSTESIFVSSTNTDQEFKSYILSSTNSTIPPDSFCSGFTTEECLIKKAKYVPYLIPYNDEYFCNNHQL